MRIAVRDEEFELLPDRCLYWPSQELLVVADVHLGKAETFQQQGLWLPAGSGGKDLSILRKVIAGRLVRRLIFLGDLVHSMAGVTGEVREDFARWMRNFGGEVQVVVGNHDAGLAKRWPAAWEQATLCDHVRLGDFVFQHHPVSKADAKEDFYWVGHLHPTIPLQKGPDRVRLPGFVISEFQGLLPAFSNLSGGYDVPTSFNDRVFVSNGERVYEV
jgi:DNA ligase-associated metallophosphoesterase